MKYRDFVIFEKTILLVEVPGDSDSDAVREELVNDGFVIVASGPGRDPKDAESVTYRAEKQTPIVMT